VQVTNLSRLNSHFPPISHDLPPKKGYGGLKYLFDFLRYMWL